MGSSEIGNYSLSEADQEDWQYYRFQDDSGFVFEEFDNDEGLFELVLERHPDPEKKQNIFCVFPDLQEYRSRDLWKKHESKEGLWLYHGRADDFVKLGSLTKFWATHVESLLEREPCVRGVIMAGDEREKTFLLVQMDESAVEADFQLILSKVVEINKDLAEEIRIDKDLVLFTNKEKPMKRTGKLTVKRRETLAEYKEEIEGLYRKIAI
jgi:hypothetical protein